MAFSQRAHESVYPALVLPGLLPPGCVRYVRMSLDPATAEARLASPAMQRVIWATVDPSAGRAGIKPFVVEAGTPGLKVTKLEHKMGIRASDTVSLVLENCRIPLGNLLGSAELVDRTKGFKGAMATFDATRPSVAASALGILQRATQVAVINQTAKANKTNRRRGVLLAGRSSVGERCRRGH
jgi:hypothetical protein